MSPTPRPITPTLARRLALVRQHLAGPRPAPDKDGLMQVARSLRYLQIDPIRAVERTQYLVLFSRLGVYDPALLNSLTYEDQQLFEYWAHAAALVLTEDYPIHHANMQNFPRGSNRWSQRVRTWLGENLTFQEYLLETIRAQGPLQANQLEDRAETQWHSGGWTSAQNVRTMLSFLWEGGKVMVSQRDGLRRYWDIPERCLPDWTPRETLTDEERVRRAAQLSLRSLGAATAAHIGNNFTSGRYPGLEQALDDLEREGQIVRVQVVEEDGNPWDKPWFVHAADIPLLDQLAAGAWQPRTTLLSPFDNLIRDRTRTELLFDYHFRMEIYVPKVKRQYGYYVLSILHGDEIIGRIDPKMYRRDEKLQINAVYAEPNTTANDETGRAVAGAIEELAEFLGAREIVYGEKMPEGWVRALRGR